MLRREKIAKGKYLFRYGSAAMAQVQRIERNTEYPSMNGDWEILWLHGWTRWSRHRTLAECAAIIAQHYKAQPKPWVPFVPTLSPMRFFRKDEKR